MDQYEYIVKARNEVDDERPDLDFGMLASALGLVEKIATVAPRATNLSSFAMEEVKAADEHVKEWADRRAARQQEIDAEYNAEIAERKMEEEQADADRSHETIERTDKDRSARLQAEAVAARAPQPRVLQPGEPVPDDTDETVQPAKPAAPVVRRA